jgi:hypothetical protein
MDDRARRLRRSFMRSTRTATTSTLIHAAASLQRSRHHQPDTTLWPIAAVVVTARASSSTAPRASWTSGSRRPLARAGRLPSSLVQYAYKVIPRDLLIAALVVISSTRRAPAGPPAATDAAARCDADRATRRVPRAQPRLFLTSGGHEVPGAWSTARSTAAAQAARAATRTDREPQAVQEAASSSVSRASQPSAP